jgi:cyclopropane fatty-acyl-phospholipid synthase-like methyltransferase
LSLPELVAQRRRVESFYDKWTERFVAGFGTTLQAGFAKAGPDAGEDAVSSALLLASRAGLRDGDRILDAGCGVGGPAVAIAAGFPRCSVHGVTASSVQAAMAGDVVADAGLTGRVTISRADYHHLPFADGQFDAAVFFESCGYSPNRAALFAEAARVVRPGGVIYVKDVFARSDPLTDVEAATLEAFDDLWQLASSPTLPEVAGALVDAGCEVRAAGVLPDIGTARFVAAMMEPDPRTILRLNELGRTFALSAPDCPTFFGEVLACRQ